MNYIGDQRMSTGAGGTGLESLVDRKYLYTFSDTLEILVRISVVIAVGDEFYLITEV